MSETRVISVGDLNVEAGSGYVAVLAQSFVQPENTIFRVPRDTEAPVATNVALGLQVCYLQVVVLDAGVAADDVDARRRALLRQFDSSRGPVTVVIENAAGTPRRRYMQFVASKVDPIEGQYGKGFVAALESADEVRWRATTAEEVTWTINASGTRSLTCAGDLDVYPTYTLTPNSAKTTPNWPYIRMILVEWRSPFGGSHPIDITGGGLDTAALLTAEKITDESNIAVKMNGVLKRHFYGNDVYDFGTTQTRIWIDMEFRPAVFPVTADYIFSNSTTWKVENDFGLPPSGTLQVGDEIVTYTGRAPGFLYGVARGQYGTTAAAHDAAELITYYQGVGWLVYGPDAVTPENLKSDAYRAAQEPMMLQAAVSSSNAIWQYQMFGWRGRPKSWGYASYLNSLGFVDESDVYGVYDAAWVEPWNAIGFRAGWTSLAIFSNRFAIPIKSLRVQGRRMVRLSPAAAPAAPRLSVLSEDQRQRKVVWAAEEGAGRDSNFWFDFETEDVRPFGYDDDIGFNRVHWSVAQAGHLQADIQVMYVRFDDNYLPNISLSGEMTEYDLDLTLTNTTTGESLTIQMPNISPDESLVIDSQWQTVTYTRDGSSQYGAVQRDQPRPKFLRLVPGVNDFQITEAGMGELEIVVAYRPRWYA